MLAGTDDHLTWLSPVILNLENMGLTHLESEIRVIKPTSVTRFWLSLSLQQKYLPLKTPMPLCSLFCMMKFSREFNKTFAIVIYSSHCFRV